MIQPDGQTVFLLVEQHKVGLLIPVTSSEFGVDGAVFETCCESG